MSPTVAFFVVGLASWYGPQEAGHIMANGHRFDPAAMTCAAAKYRFGTKLLVEYNGRAVVVTVTDRLGEAAIRNGRLLDLSQAAFARIAPLAVGVVRVRYSIFPAVVSRVKASGGGAPVVGGGGDQLCPVPMLAEAEARFRLAIPKPAEAQRSTSRLSPLSSTGIRLATGSASERSVAAGQSFPCVRRMAAPVAAVDGSRRRGEPISRLYDERGASRAIPAAESWPN